MKPFIIGLTGRAGAGKDTVADYLVQHHGYTKRSLATPIKELLNARFGWTMEDWEDREWKERPCIGNIGGLANLSPRQLAQWLGTEVGRTLGGPDVWIEKLFNDGGAGKYLVIPDIRFQNEAMYLFNNVPQGRLRIFEVIRYTAYPVESHISEAGIPRAFVHDIITNKGDFEALFTEVEAVLR